MDTAVRFTKQRPVYLRSRNGLTYHLREATRQLLPLETLRIIVREEGLTPLKSAAARLVSTGTTTLNEFLKV